MLNQPAPEQTASEKPAQPVYTAQTQPSAEQRIPRRELPLTPNAKPQPQPAAPQQTIPQPEPEQEPEEPVYTRPNTSSDSVISDDDFDDIMSLLKKPKRRDDFRGGRR